MPIQIAIVDAFTSKPFAGNPAAVCILENPISEAQMQQIAEEMNLSETAFLHPQGSGYHLRWFTPKSEVKLCGHATLASAHLLWESGKTSASQIEFNTLSGKLSASRREDEIVLNFPVEPVIPFDLPEKLIEAIGAPLIFTGKTDVRYFVEVAFADDVRSLTPDLASLSKFLPGRLIVTARSDDPQFDFISRYFAPGIGIPEDPVTGSAHCALAHYWSEKLSKNKFNAYQASARGGSIKVSLIGDRVELGGKAVTVMRGTLAI